MLIKNSKIFELISTKNIKRRISKSTSMAKTILSYIFMASIANLMINHINRQDMFVLANSTIKEDYMTFNLTFSDLDLERTKLSRQAIFTTPMLPLL